MNNSNLSFHISQKMYCFLRNKSNNSQISEIKKTSKICFEISEILIKFHLFSWISLISLIFMKNLRSFSLGNPKTKQRTGVNCPSHKKGGMGSSPETMMFYTLFFRYILLNKLCRLIKTLVN